MIKNRTVLILGAGASKPYGFPLGQELRDEVIRAIRRKNQNPWASLANLLAYSSMFGNLGIPERDYSKFARDLAESGFPSVDAFLENRDKWLEIGKAAMALCLLRTEARAKMKLFPPDQPRDHWYECLWEKLRAPSWEAFKKNPISIVTFNYERSLEHYLVRLVCNNYRLFPDEVANALPIVHVHGSLGRYTRQPFGDEISLVKLRLAASSIRVVHEQATERTLFPRARSLIRRAKVVLFIGFGYHEQNMAKLGTLTTRDRPPTTAAVLGTHKGIKAQAWEAICSRYHFSSRADREGGGTISEFVTRNLW
jgi:hypothetical protein